MSRVVDYAARSCQRAQELIAPSPRRTVCLVTSAKLARGHERDFRLQAVLGKRRIATSTYSGAISNGNAPRALGRQHRAATAAERI